MSYGSLQGQQSMAFDITRNKVYEAALKAAITPQSVVLDLGAGLGPFGLLAAKLGAKKVYLVEPQPLIRTVRNIVRTNGWQDRVECIQGRIEDLNLPEKVDIITSCFTGNFLLSEDLLPLLFLARDKFLKPDGVLLPGSGTMIAVPVCSPKLHQRQIAYLSKLHLGIDYSYYRQQAANNFIKNRNLGSKNYLAKPKAIKTVDFYTANIADCNETIHFRINQNTTCHGFLAWFDMTLGKEVLSTAPDKPVVHWSPLWFPIDPPLRLKKNQNIELTVKKPQNKPWSWIISTKKAKRVHSSFLMSASQRGGISGVKKSGLVLNQDSQILLFALRHISQGSAKKLIAEKLQKNWPAKFNKKVAAQYVSKLIGQHVTK